MAKICGCCEYTDKLCYTSNPPKVRCQITSKFHYYNDTCELEAKETCSDMMNLVPAIKEIEKQIQEIEIEYKLKKKPYLDSLNSLRQINEACEKCGGKGRVLRSRACAEDDAPDPADPRDYIICNSCCGTGRNDTNGLCSTSTLN